MSDNITKDPKSVATDSVVDVNQSMSLRDVIERLQIEQQTRADAVVSTKDDVEMFYDEDTSKVLVGINRSDVPALDGRELPATRWAHQQIAARAGVPKTYYDRMLYDAPLLLTDNINHWWKREPEARLLRAVGSNGDGRVRAWLSNRFRMLDNLDGVTTTLQAAEPFNASVRNAHITDDRMHLQLVTPRIVEVPKRKGERLQLGLTLMNSEVGDGRFTVQPWSLNLACINGMVVAVSYKRTHLGSKLDFGVLSDETIKLENEAIWAQIADWVRYALSAERLDDLVEDLDLSIQTRITATARVATANIVKRLSMTRSEGQAVLERYLQQDDPTQYGMAQAVTYIAHAHAESFRRRIELETGGGEIIADREFEKKIDRPVSDKEIEKLLGIAA